MQTASKPNSIPLIILSCLSPSVLHESAVRFQFWLKEFRGFQKSCKIFICLTNYTISEEEFMIIGVSLTKSNNMADINRDDHKNVHI